MGSSYTKFFIGLGFGCGGTLLLVIVAVLALTFISNDFVEVDQAWVTEHTNIPCEHLKVGQAIHDLDHEDVHLLDTEITDREAFEKDLAEAGWVCREKTAGRSYYVYTKDNGQSLYLYISYGENGVQILQTRYE